MSLHPDAHLHLEWIKRNPNFVPDIPLRDGYRSYYEDMLNFWTWNCKISPSAVPMMANRWLLDDMKLSQTYETRLREKQKTLKLTKVTKMWFVTLGFNHQTWSIPKCLKLLSRIMAYDWVLSCNAVFEINRVNGKHPHMHLLIKSDFASKSKVIDKIWRSDLCQELILSRSFIQCDPGVPEHEDYVRGIKTQSKMACVVADRLWRQENNIPDLFTK